MRIGDYTPLKTVQSRIVFSDYLIFLSYFLAILFVISLPIFGIQLSNSPLKHLPLAVLIVAYSLHIVGQSINEGAPKVKVGSSLFRDLWPFMFLGGYATIGSLIANFAYSEQESFLTFGVYFLLVIPFYKWVESAVNKMALLEIFVKIWGLSVILSSIGTLARMNYGEPLHEIEFWILPYYIYLYFELESRYKKVFTLVALVCTAILTQKLTGYVIGIGAIIYLMLIELHRATAAKWRSFINAISIFVLFVVFLLMAIGYVFFQDELPSGNVNVRLHQYEIAMSSFINSPLWGRAYLGGSGEIFVESSKVFNLPTHSDLLDLLKQGGLIAFLLWFVGMYKVFRLLLVDGLCNDRESSFFHSILFMAMAVVFTLAFNPLLLKPPFGYVIWGTLAFSMSIASANRVLIKNEY